ncbi:hypothetical protein ACWDPI_38625, partial [Streptomyces zhihengii]
VNYLGQTWDSDQPFDNSFDKKLFVNPVVEGAKLPELFTRHGAVVEKPATVAPKTIADKREQWVRSWSSLVLK